MAKVNNQTKVILTVLISIVVAYFGFRFMQDLPLFQGSKTVYTQFQQVNGLTTGSYIYVKGVKVGSVNDIELLATDSVRVRLGFNASAEITRGSVAYLRSSGLLGDKAIYIEKGKSNELVPDGGTIKGVYSAGMMESFKEQGAELTNDASEVFSKLNETLTQLQQVADKGNRKKIDQLLTNLEQSTNELSTLMQQKRSELASSIDHANRFLANLDTISTENSASIDSALAGLDRSMQNLEQVSAELETTNNRLNSVLAKIDEGEGSLGKLVNDPSLYNNMDSLSVELKQLIKNINEDPARYLKGLKLIDVF